MSSNDKHLNSRAFELQVSCSQRLNASSILISMCEYWNLALLNAQTALREIRYVIANNTIETGSDAGMINDAILQGILPKMPLNVITVEQAIDALSRSKAIYY